MILCNHNNCPYNEDGLWCTKKIVVIGNNAVCKQVWDESGQMPVYKQPRSQEELKGIPKRKFNIVEAEIILQEDAAKRM